ncbi:MAG: response regulator [Syntrophorhabdales bacterium]|jgi:two-component system chemotaxis response regulator CheY
MKKILVVDDSPTVRKLLGYVLRLKNYDVEEAEDGMDAMEKLSESEVDLVIVDLNMPNMDGISFVKSLRNSYYNLDLPVIMLTTTNDAEVREEAYGAGINMFLTKPVQPEILLYKIDSLIGGGA